MFRAKYQKVAVLKKVVEAVKDLVSAASFECGPDGVILEAMDSSHVSFIALLLRADSFDEYLCEKPSVLCVDFPQLGAVLKTAGNESAVVLEAKEGGDKLKLTFLSAKDNITASFELKLLDLQAEQLSIPKCDYQCDVELPAADFQKVVRDLANVEGDSIAIGCSKQAIEFACSGRIADGSMRFPATKTAFIVKDTVKQLFALKYLAHFAKATPLSDNVHLCMSQDLPMLVEYVIEDYGYLKFYLAPKIED